MDHNTVLHGKKILAVSDDADVLRKIEETVVPRGANYFSYKNPTEAAGNILAKKPDLVIYDDRLPAWNGMKPLSLIKRARPMGRILLLTRYRVPQRSIDVSAQGVSYSLPYDAQSEEMYNVIKHCLSITSVPRVEKAG